MRNATATPKEFVKTIDRELIRGTNVIDLKPLSSLHTTQRVVHAIMKGCDTDDFIPYNEEQRTLSLITEYIGGSPDIIDVTSTVLVERLSQEDGIKQRRKVLEEFCEDVIEREDSERNSESPELTKAEEQFPLSMVATESVAKTKCDDDEDKALKTSTVVSFTSNLLKYLNLPQTDYFLLMALHWFGPIPIPHKLIEILQSLIMSANKSQSPSKGPFVNLLSSKLLRVYPSTVIVTPTSSTPSYSTPTSTASIKSDSASALSLIHDSDFYYVPQLICDAIKHQLEPMDKDFSLTATLKALKHCCKEDGQDLTHVAGLTNILSNRTNEQNICFQDIYRLYLSLVTRTK